jgi:Fe-Mn family superoxide dismutase
MTVKLPDLPYKKDALEPHISARTLEYHHDKHHKAYVDTLNEAIENTDYSGLTLEEMIAQSHGTSHTNVYNNAAQAWNHEFLWKSMSPDGGGDADGSLKEALHRRFGDVARFGEAFRRAATGQFGSGWAWLVLDKGELNVISTSDADNPLVKGQKPLLTLDLWEHAYYLDYQNERGRYVDTFLEHLINWKFASARYNALKAAA